MGMRFLGVAMTLCFLLPVIGGGGKDEGKKNVVVRFLVHAKKTTKFGPGLSAVQVSGGTLVGVGQKGGVVVEVPAASADAAEKRLKKVEAKVARANRVVAEPVNRLILTYAKNAKVTAADLKKVGYKLHERHETDDTILLLVEPVAPLDAAGLTRLAKDPDLQHAELDAPVSISLPDK